MVTRFLKPLLKHRIAGIALLGILFLSVSAPWLYRYVTTPKSADLGMAVQTIRVKKAVMPEVIETVGHLTAKEELRIKAVIPAKIVLQVESGAFVKKGTLLAEMIGAPEVRAPFDGYLTDWNVKTGEYVTTGDRLVDLVNTDALTLSYRVPEQYAAKLALSQAVEVSVKAYPGKLFKGAVYFVSPVVATDTHTILLKATVQNTDHLLKPGMLAQVKEILALHQEALVIPVSCLILTLEGYEVFLVSDGKIEKRRVTVGERYQGRAHIVSGLKEGDAVVLVRTNRISEGALARPEDFTGDW